MVFFTPGGILRFHCPMHGPHALASTVAPASSKSLTNPSFSMFTCTALEPGVTKNGILYVRPAASAWRVRLAHFAMSS